MSPLSTPPKINVEETDVNEGKEMPSSHPGLELNATCPTYELCDFGQASSSLSLSVYTWKMG